MPRCYGRLIGALTCPAVNREDREAGLGYVRRIRAALRSGHAADLPDPDPADDVPPRRLRLVEPSDGEAAEPADDDHPDRWNERADLR